MKGLLLPEPTYKGPENIVYFRDNNFTEEISRDKNVVWMVTFYAAWSPASIDFASIFSKLSSEYGLPNLKFGKVSWREIYIQTTPNVKAHNKLRLLCHI